MSKDETSRYSRFKSSVQKNFDKFQERHKKRIQQAKDNSDKNSWDNIPDIGDLSFSTRVKNYLKYRSLYIFPALITKKDQEREVIRELARKLFGVSFDANSTTSPGQQSGKKTVNGWLGVMNFLAWPFAFLKLGITSFNSIVDTVDLAASLALLNFIKRLTPETYENKIQEVIKNVKKTGSLPARVIKRLVNFVEIIPATILFVPIDFGREIDAWFDERRAESAASKVSNTAAPAAVAEQVSDAPTNNTQTLANRPPAAARENSENAAVADDSKEATEKTLSGVSQEVHQVAVQTDVELSSLDDKQKNIPVELEQGQEQKQKVELQQERTEAVIRPTQDPEFGPAHHVIALCGFGVFAKEPEITEAAATTLHQRSPSFAA